MHSTRWSLATVAGAGLFALQPFAAQSSPLNERIAHHAQSHGVPVALAKAVVRLESNFNPRAANRGNFGLMQIRLGTARSMGYRGSAAGLLDPEVNLTYGMRYLAKARALSHGDACGAIMRYQSGLGATRPSAANRAYCARARAIMAKAP